jgi:hypothetical protein
MASSGDLRVTVVDGGRIIGLSKIIAELRDALSRCWGSKRFVTARGTIVGVEAMNMLRKRQVSAVPVSDMPSQRAFIATLFGFAA